MREGKRNEFLGLIACTIVGCLCSALMLAGALAPAELMAGRPTMAEAPADARAWVAMPVL